jgi:hypothetical protein
VVRRGGKVTERIERCRGTDALRYGLVDHTKAPTRDSRLRRRNGGEGRRRIAFVALLGVWGFAALVAQQPAPRFEVVSIKPQPNRQFLLKDFERTIPHVQPGGVFNPTHATVEALVYFAYDLKAGQLTSAPDWVRHDPFQIDARAGGDVPADRIRLMVRSLLEDRFKLVTHREQREMRFQALVRARADGPLGPELSSMDGCSPAMVNELRRKLPEKYPFPIGSMVGGCSPGVSLLAGYLTTRLELSSSTRRD